jgi:hypothetical protein
MAVKITTDGIVQTANPSTSYFSITELESIIGGFIEPVKIGPVWVMYTEESKTKAMQHNYVASDFFNIAIYGDVLVVPPQQLPPDWDIMDEEDYKYTSKQVEEGFLIALQRSLIQNMKSNSVRGIVDANTGYHVFNMKEEYLYAPPETLAIDDFNTRDFYRQVCEKKLDVERLKNEGVILEESEVVIRIKDHADKVKCLEQMIEYYLETEEYETCAEIRNAMKILTA